MRVNATKEQVVVLEVVERVELEHYQDGHNLTVRDGALQYRHTLPSEDKSDICPSDCQILCKIHRRYRKFL